eukprot:8852032-Pyramimonas_sp.AAC.1
MESSINMNTAHLHSPYSSYWDYCYVYYCSYYYYYSYYYSYYYYDYYYDYYPRIDVLVEPMGSMRRTGSTVGPHRKDARDKDASAVGAPVQAFRAGRGQR